MNRNSTRLDALFMQITSGKVIQNPSDNPIVASRALRFRTNVTEIEQFSRNVDQAISWMGVSEQSLQNMTNIFTTQRSELLVQGASSTYTYQNRQTITRVVELLFQQTHTELNGTFAGRYLFSGFRTDEPPIITENNLTTVTPTNNISFNISKNIERIDINDAGALFWRDPNSTPEANQLVTVATREWLERPDRVEADWESYTNLVTVPGNLNIMRLPYNATADRTMTPPTLTVPGTPPTALTVVSRSITGAVNPYVPVAGEVTFIPETGELIIPDDLLNSFNNGVTANYTINGVYQGELNPVIFFDTRRIHNGETIDFRQADQEIKFEVGTNVRLTINTQAREAYPWQLFADMQSLIHWANNVQTSPIPPATAEQVARETAFFSEMLHTKFTNTMARMDIHMQTTTTEYAALGSRMERMEMIENRLLENRDTFRALRDQNENIDYLEILMQLNAAEAVFQAAMQVGARISQLSLVNYI
jgi:flagellar hook-associated protein 3 FlgL